MLKYENVAQVGDTIKALDFRPMSDRPDQYLIGRVIEKGPMYYELEAGRRLYMCDGYKVLVSFDSYDGDRVMEEIVVPFETTFDYDGRVELVA